MHLHVTIRLKFIVKYMKYNEWWFTRESGVYMYITVNQFTYIGILYAYILPYLSVVCIGQVSCDHSGSKSPVREVHHLGLSKDRTSTKNVVARS